MVAPKDKGGPQSSLAPRNRRVYSTKGYRLSTWNGTKTLNQSALMIRKIPKPTAHKAIGDACNFEQDRQ